MLPKRELGDFGQCEAQDWIPTADDAVMVRCQNDGRVIRETVLRGYTRYRCVCPKHGLTSAMETN